MKMMDDRKPRWLPFLAWLLLMSRAWASPIAVDLPQDPLAGREVFYQKQCGRCHAVWGQGPELGPDLGRQHDWGSVFELAGVLWNHTPQMIEKMAEQGVRREEISAEEMSDLAAFLYFLAYFDDPGDPAAGAKVFTRERCERCHGPGGRGGSLGPSLAKYRQFASPLILATAMWSHGPKMMETMAAQGIRRPRLAGRDIADLHAFLVAESDEPVRQMVYLLPGSPARGQEVFSVKKCDQCHAIRGEGSRVGPDLGKSDLRRAATEIAGLMWDHEPAMWQEMEKRGIELPTFDNQEIADLIAFLHFIQYSDVPGDAKKGKDIFVEKECIFCHYAPAGAKRSIARELIGAEFVSSPLKLGAAMWNHAPLMEQEFKERGLPWPQFRGDEMRDLVEYLRSQSVELGAKHDREVSQ